MKSQITELSEKYEIATTIHTQLSQSSINGWPFYLAVAVDKRIAGESSLTLKIANSGQKCNTVIINYDAGADLYNIEFWNCRVLTRNPYIIQDKLEAIEGIYFDAMAELIYNKIRSFS